MVLGSGGPAAPVPLAPALPAVTPSAAALRLQAAVRGWLVRRGDAGVEPLWLREAAGLLAADGDYAGAAEVDGAAGASGAADAAVSALLALLGHGEHSKVTLSVTLSVTPFYWCNGLHPQNRVLHPLFGGDKGVMQRV